MAQERLGLQDDDFWADPLVDSDRWVSERLDAKALGVTIAAPQYVPIDTRDSLPMVGVVVRTLREELQIELELQTLAVAIDLDTNDFRIGPAIATGKTPAPSDVPEYDPGDGFVGQTIEGDLRQALQLPWKPARYLIGVILRERISNVLTTTLRPSVHRYQDPAVAAHLAQRSQQRPREPAPLVWPPIPEQVGAISRALGRQRAPLPSYVHHDDSPSLPDGMGIALHIDRVFDPGANNRCVARGSFRLPRTAGRTVGRDPNTGKLDDVGVDGATAVVFIHLVATGADVTGPFVFPLRVPCLHPVDDDTPELTGYFNLDLFQFTNMPQRAGAYFFYAFSLEAVTGPVPLGIAPPAGGV